MADPPRTGPPPPTLAGAREAGEAFLKAGAPLVAYDVLATGLKEFPTDVRLRQLTALALARTGASRAASRILQQLIEEGHTDEETLGLLARTYKDLWADCEDPAERSRYLGLALKSYQEAYQLSGGYWSGINAATMALLLGDRAGATELARRVRTRCLELRPTTPAGDQYWILATLGEASLVLQERGEASEWYGRAFEIGRRRFGDLASTRRNARLILRYLDVDDRAIEACLRIPRVAVFSGHLIDRPDRAHPRFPPELESEVGAAIRSRLEEFDVGFGYASAACGADILFLEALGARNAEAHIVLPYNPEQFRQDSVDILPESTWPERYQRVLDAAADLVVASDQRMLGGAMSYEYGFRMLDGLAAIKADELDTELICLAVWDGKPGDGPGGTAASVDRWREAGRHIAIVELDAMLRRRVPEPVAGAREPAHAAAPAAGPVPQTQRFDPQIVGLLFADAKGFSRLTEEEIPRFVEHFLGTVASELKASPEAPLLTNTWGDGLYFVFQTVSGTGEFALRLSEAVRRKDWRAHGLPEGLGIRIGLHAGPAYACLDPVTGRLNYLGAHVSLAARIEPITPPGEVYASGAFAAVARTEEIRTFRCAYVGQTPLAKDYGTVPTYVVRRRRE